jgi:acetoin utilization protein AcuB
MEVRHHMTRHPVTVGPNDSLRKARLLMAQGGFRHLPVIENRRVVGIVTDRDIYERSPSGVVEGLSVERTDLMNHLRVMGIMTLRPLTISAHASVLEAAQLLRSKHLGALLVVEGDELVGIITKGDLLDALVAYASSDLVS